MAITVEYTIKKIPCLIPTISPEQSDALKPPKYINIRVREFTIQRNSARDKANSKTCPML